MSKLKTLAYKVAFPAALSAYAVSASADTSLADIGTSFATEIAKFAGIVLAIGMAGVSVVISISAFKMAFAFIKSIR